VITSAHWLLSTNPQGDLTKKKAIRIVTVVKILNLTIEEFVAFRAKMCAFEVGDRKNKKAKDVKNA
jgi:hypothetical protein